MQCTSPARALLSASLHARIQTTGPRVRALDVPLEGRLGSSVDAQPKTLPLKQRLVCSSVSRSPAGARSGCIAAGLVRILCGAEGAKGAASRRSPTSTSAASSTAAWRKASTPGRDRLGVATLVLLPAPRPIQGAAERVDTLAHSAAAAARRGLILVLLHPLEGARRTTASCTSCTEGTDARACSTVRVDAAASARGTGCSAEDAAAADAPAEPAGGFLLLLQQFLQHADQFLRSREALLVAMLLGDFLTLLCSDHSLTVVLHLHVRLGHGQEGRRHSNCVADGLGNFQ